MIAISTPHNSRSISFFTLLFLRKRYFEQCALSARGRIKCGAHVINVRTDAEGVILSGVGLLRHTAKVRLAFARSG